MRGFFPGLLVGAALGAAGLYLVLEGPWGRPGRAARSLAPEAGPAEVEEAGETAEARRGRGRKRRRPGGAGAGAGEPRDAVVVLTEADRRPVWRGPAVELPPRDLDFGAGGGGRSLAQPEIDAGIAGGRQAASRCIADARGDAELEARVELVFLVEADGRVGKVRVRAPGYLMKRGLYECMRRAVGAMRFPGTGAATVVRVPFDLS